MKRIVIATVMLSMVLSAGIAISAELNIFVPWFVNDPYGIQKSLFDTWIQLKNVTDSTITMNIDYYDDSNYFVVATTDTITLVPGAGEAYYTGVMSYTYSMLGNADRGSINCRWEEITPGSEAKDEILGYLSYNNWSGGFGLGINFVY